MSSPADVLEALRAANDGLLQQYKEHMQELEVLTTRLVLDVLPGVLDDMRATGDYDEDQVLTMDAEARAWLEDTGSTFRMLRRHKFTKSFAVQYLRETLLWRLQTLSPFTELGPPEFLRVLSRPAADPFRRPIVLVKGTDLSSLNMGLLQEHGDTTNPVVHAAEHLRRLLASLQDQSVMQCVLVLDVQGLTMRTLDVGLLRWYTAEVQPRFPGLVGAVFVVNYSWTQSGLWSVAKRLLPKSTLGRIFFVGNEQLCACLGVANVPAEYGGTLRTHMSPRSPPPAVVAAPPARTPSTLETYLPRVRSLHALLPRAASILPMSALNPFFGYPVTAAPPPVSTGASGGPGGPGAPPPLGRQPTGVPALRHGRRRKRDLARALAVLWWRRWGARVRGLGMVALLLAVVWAAWARVRARRGLRLAGRARVAL